MLPEEGPLADDLRAADVEVLVRPLAVLRRELVHPRGLARLARAVSRDARGLGAIIRGRGIALVHSNTSVILGGAAAARLTGVPHIWHVREIYSRFGRAWPPYRALLQQAAALPCVSGATAAQFTARARVLYDGLAVDAWRAERAAARRALGVAGELPVLAVLGRITDWKGQSVLAQALAHPGLRERGALALIAGDVWPGAEHRRDALLREARRAGVGERMRLVGFRPDVENVFGAADLVVVPSVEPDPLPGSAIEAAAAGCAVLASAIGGLPEIVQDGVSGRLFPAGDPRALARIAGELLDSPAELARLGEQARHRARARFDPGRLREEIDALWSAVLARG